MTNVAIVVPTLNAASQWAEFQCQLLSNASPSQILILDSTSSDRTAELAREAGFRVYVVSRSSFNHGGTRQLGIEMFPTAEIVVFLTQDAILTGSESIAHLLRVFEDPKVGAAFGRQLPHIKATPIEAHARLHNYPAQSTVRSFEDRLRYGFKTIFISNSFAAYRREALLEVGGFSSNVIFGEDTIAAGRMVLAGWKIAYVADATVYHSHDYTWIQEFKRYFDIGVLHAREAWMLENFGSASGQGKAFVRSELAYLWPHYWWLIPSAIVRTCLKFAGYRMGRREASFPARWKRQLSMHRHFWS